MLPAATPRRLTEDLVWCAGFLRIFLFIAASAALWFVLFGFFERKIEVRTGRAEWIWIEHPLLERRPVAFATFRDFTPPSDRTYAVVSVAAHPEYTLYVNDRLVGGGEPGRAPTLDRYEVNPLLRDGTNRLTVVARARDGVGGILVTLDYGPNRRNAVTTPSGWRIAREAGEDGRFDLSSLESPRVLGRPPAGPWNSPAPLRRENTGGPTALVEPVDVQEASFSLPEVAVLSGVAVMRERRVEGRIFDFGHTSGRIRLIREAAANEPSLLEWRTANDPSELHAETTPEAAVFAPGELVYDTPTPRSFRYVIVYDSTTRAQSLAPVG